MSPQQGIRPHGGGRGAQGMTETKESSPSLDSQKVRKLLGMGSPSMPQEKTLPTEERIREHGGNKGKRLGQSQSPPPPEMQVGTSVWKLHLGSDQQKETRKGGNIGC